MSATPIRVSVCMAAYQGAAYIREQLDSIVEQLGQHDELIVVDDGSTDATAEVVESVRDARVHLLRNESNLGYVRTFDRALSSAKGEYLFLADQDDVWLPGRLETMLAGLQQKAVVSTSVSILGDTSSRPAFFLRASDSERHLANIFAVMVGYRPYTGCAMAFRRNIYDSVVPIPRFVYESHDLWLALVANTHRENLHLETASVARRLHDANQTPLGWRGPKAIVRARWMKMKCLVVAMARSRPYRTRARLNSPAKSALRANPRSSVAPRSGDPSRRSETD